MQLCKNLSKKKQLLLQCTDSSTFYMDVPPHNVKRDCFFTPIAQSAFYSITSIPLLDFYFNSSILVVFDYILFDLCIIQM